MYNDIIKQQIIQDYYNNVSLYDIRLQYGITNRTLYNWLEKNNLQIRESRSSKYTKNKYYFSIPNNENSYWAGFIAADGHVLKNNKAIKIRLSVNDLNHLIEFKTMCDYNGPIKIYDNKNEGYSNKQYCILNIGSASQWCKDLYNNFNIISGNKTFNLKFPRHLNDNNKLSFIAGFIDGDGCISYDIKERKYRLSLVSGSIDMLNVIKEYFDKKYIVSNYKQAMIRTKLNCYTYAIGGKRLNDLMEDIKQLNVPLMSRKWYK